MRLSNGRLIGSWFQLFLLLLSRQCFRGAPSLSQQSLLVKAQLYSNESANMMSESNSGAFDELYFSEDENEERILREMELGGEGDDECLAAAAVRNKESTNRKDAARRNHRVKDNNDTISPSRDGVIATTDEPATDAVKGSRHPHTRSTRTSTYRNKHQRDSVMPPDGSNRKESYSIPNDEFVENPIVAPNLAEQNQKQEKQQQRAALFAITTPWVRKFLSSCHRDVLLPVPKDYCADAFNLVLLPPFIEQIGETIMDSQSLIQTRAKSTNPYPIYRQALKLLTQDNPVPPNLPDHIHLAATALYLLLHQRYVVSPRGLDMVRRRFLLKALSTPTTNDDFRGVNPIFGRCPILECQGMPLLPIGESDNFHIFSRNTSRGQQSQSSSESYLAKRYCASCGQLFYHWDSKVDGCAWGTTFCHLFLMVCGQEVFGDWHRFTNKPRDNPEPEYVPKIFGFKLHPSAVK